MERDSLRDYYQRELRHLREDGADFARRYPKIAANLGLSPGAADDPLVERLLESMAYLTARVRREAEAELPGLAGQILDLMCPSLAAPLPSLAVATFAPNPEAKNALGALGEPWLVPAGASLYTDPGGEKPPVRWRTGWDLSLTAGRVTKTNAQAMTLKKLGGEGGECAVLRLRWTGLKGGENLRVFLRGDRFSTFPLHDWVHTAGRRVFLIKDAEAQDCNFKALELPKNFLRPAGLEVEDLILPGFGRVWPGFRLLQEYFACPERFLFWHLGPWPPLGDYLSPDGTVDLVVTLTAPPPPGLAVTPEMFDPAAVPVVNLFERLAEPVQLDYRRTGYLLRPDLRRADSTEIHSVLSVTALGSGGQRFEVPHFFNRETPAAAQAKGLCWHIRRCPAPDERGTATTLYLMGGAMDEELTLAPRVLCTNRHLAAQSGLCALQAETQLPPGAGPALILAPTPQRDPAWSGDERWRLAANFALAPAALSGEDGPEVLKNILRLYAPAGDVYSQRQIAGIMDLSAAPFIQPLRPGPGRPFGGVTQGLALGLELDPEAFSGGSPYIFAGVLEVFLGLRAALNQVVQMKLFLADRKGVYCQWPPRCGARPVL